jgi:AcrR family transcriptional regulator
LSQLLSTVILTSRYRASGVIVQRDGRLPEPVVTTAGRPSGGEGREAAVQPEVVETDGRRLRRAVNREAVVDALLDLYSEGNLRPGTDEIAERAGISPRSLFRYFEDTDDLAGEAITRQLARAMPLVGLGTERDAPFEQRVEALVDQRFRLFDAVGQAAHVSRLRAPFQPRLAANLTETRQFLREQIRWLFGVEFESMGTERAERALAAVDVLTAFESYQLLTGDQCLTVAEAKAVVSQSLSALLASPEPR